ncbi:hypothetical protein CIW83_20380 [Tissierella sp. P1]|uniref:DUF3160 domain-containing protein n=1 Tax=Tissierella sp. P1 TaxID=1280483 RepID=UPI000BA0675A|nr:DUF3160 domain-containing protein [Tissierella sp. P1]OZV10434.1 hypothetical protein CIW83_20380 [Tissierella sp. P1]
MKRKSLYLIISLILFLSIIMTGCIGKEVNKIEKEDLANVPDFNENKEETNIEVNQGLVNIGVPYEPIEFEVKVEPYKVKADLSNIENLKIFGEFSEEQLELLVKNNFVVNPTKKEQLFYIYEDNEYKDIPSFITTDSILQVYHIFYDYTLRTLENDKLIGLIKGMTEKSLVDVIDLYGKLKDGKVKDAQLKNIAYFSVAQLLLGNELPENIPKESKEIALEELEKINTHSGFEKSSLFPYDLDYSQFTVRGHYTRSEDFERYFKAMMWYGQAPFPLYFADGERNIEQTLQALLITYSYIQIKKTIINGRIYMNQQISL